MSWVESLRRRALAKDNGGHTGAWALKAHPQSLEKDEGSESDGRVELGAVEGNET